MLILEKKVDTKPTTPHNPMANPVERMHRELKKYLKAEVADWPTQERPSPSVRHGPQGDRPAIRKELQEKGYWEADGGGGK